MDNAQFWLHARRIMAPLFRPKPEPPVICFDPDDSGYRTAIVPCERCGGDGVWEVYYSYDPSDGSPIGYWEECGCYQGEIEIELFPVTPDDLDELDEQGALCGAYPS